MQCKATTKNRARCRREAVKGSQYCKTHLKSKTTESILVSVGAKVKKDYDLKKSKFNIEKRYKEVSKLDVNTINDLSNDIFLARALMLENIGELQELENKKELNITADMKAGEKKIIIEANENLVQARVEIRSQTVDMATKLSKIVEQNEKVKYDKRYNIKIETVKEVLSAIQKIIVEKVTNEEDLYAIIYEIKKQMSVISSRA